ncbi:hypothetical protein EI42_05527 [Thermosporothrix hazakensis]|jgi:hypothetical protein|uniref:Uncharacterized protein n=2 Tax=Thermosporothrix TaxID=768650 RepID=A0A326TZT9_THEHA|nr:hypothetical protein [Thermosporothrix hazakensis]PZW22394.1 hypothetical protein EI42_05527 [Thermosporothrix hazakensis]BBH91096.1 hypothetical protein KTC_58470 [Thermosporothrix sp. COM3]GCE49148.1 hypothetical protein KTH_40170 [Thermosporothrix hazakensis]
MATKVVPALVQEKLEAFEHLLPEFETCFRFVQDVHGQKRFSTCSVSDVVFYLHARWICDCKGYLLSVPRTTKMYEGKLCLELLRDWQLKEDTASVVDFLQRRLDLMPFAELTRQIHEVQCRQGEHGLGERLFHGRLVLLNRCMNLMQALETLFTLPEPELLQQVRQACERYGHTPEQIEQQLAQMESPLFAFVPHQVLAQQNMMVMNRLGTEIMSRGSDLPGQRSWRVLPAQEPLTPFAEHLFPAYQELVAPYHNNIMEHHFADPLERQASQ